MLFVCCSQNVKMNSKSRLCLSKKTKSNTSKWEAPTELQMFCWCQQLVYDRLIFFILRHHVFPYDEKREESCCIFAARLLQSACGSLQGAEQMHPASFERTESQRAAITLQGKERSSNQLQHLTDSAESCSVCPAAAKCDLTVFHVCLCCFISQQFMIVTVAVSWVWRDTDNCGFFYCWMKKPFYLKHKLLKESYLLHVSHFDFGIL